MTKPKDQDRAASGRFVRNGMAQPKRKPRDWLSLISLGFLAVMALVGIAVWLATQ